MFERITAMPTSLLNAQAAKQNRTPQFSGSLYPADAALLQSQVAAALDGSPAAPVSNLRTLIVPHDNYATALPAMAAGYKALGESIYDLVIVLAAAAAPNGRICISANGAFETPLGKLDLSDFVRNELADEEDDIFVTDAGSLETSAIEVQLPLLQESVAKRGAFKFLPILLGEQSIDFCNELGSALGEVLQQKRALLIATTNFNFSSANETAVSELLTDLQEQNYSDLLRKTMMGGTNLGDGLGTLAVASRVSRTLGANKFSLIHRESHQSAGKIYVAAGFSR